MFTASVLVRNIESPVAAVDFGEFRLEPVGPRLIDLRERFSSTDVDEVDWILEKSYTPPLELQGSLVVEIPKDVEDILLLLRLFKVGDISFTKLTITPPSGKNLVQFPYGVINDLNSSSSLRFRIRAEDASPWRAFAEEIRQTPSWRADWFGATRRFFLSGGAKQWNPERDDVDRIIDYVTALEAALVPEMDFSSRRVTHRAAALLAAHDPDESQSVRNFVKRLYEIRSQVIHGTRLSPSNRLWLLDNWPEIEHRVRQILVNAVQTLPPEEPDRRIALAGLYDPTDQDRADLAFQKFRAIKTTEIRQSTAAKIGRLVESSQR